MSVAAAHIVDDDTAVRESLLALLDAWALPAVGYESAPAFLAALSPAVIGCVVTDIQMPGMTGLELLQALRRLGSTLPVIVITARADRFQAAAAMELGAAAVLQKPFAPPQLVGLVRAALDGGGATRPPAQP